MARTDIFNGRTADDQKIIHLFVTNTCNKHCKLCCNKQYNIADIPVVTINELSSAETVCLTGGEPFLVGSIHLLAKRIKEQFKNIKNIYIYTSGESLHRWIYLHSTYTRLSPYVDGINISPKDVMDLDAIRKIITNDPPKMLNEIFGLPSNRFYIFPEIKDLIQERLGEAFDWLKKRDIDIIERQWQENFEPYSGIFRRLPILY